MPPVEIKTTRNSHWRSLNQLEDAPEFRAHAEDEFPESSKAPLNSVSRRRFLQLMGASVALSSATGCRWQKEKILPYSDRPESTAPGTPKYYATAMETGGAVRGLLIKSFDGRPIKVEGNPSHPESLGAADAVAQASILELYDPDRSQHVVRFNSGQRINQTWDDFLTQTASLLSSLRTDQGNGFRVLSEASSSPSLADMRDRLLKAFPEARWHEYEPVSRDNEREGARLAFGRDCHTHLDLQKAEVIACLDADLLGQDPSALRHTRHFAEGRTPKDGEMNRLYVVESAYTTTGANADHRLPIRSEQVLPFLLALEVEVHARLGLERPSDLQSFEPSGFLQAEKTSKFVRALAGDLAARQGRSVVTAGPRQPAAVHARVHRLNRVLKNVGQTVRYRSAAAGTQSPSIGTIASLVEAIGQGEVSTLLILGGNPVFNAPASLSFRDALEKVKATLHLSSYVDETSTACDWHLPRAHYLEAWGDARSGDGTFSIVQPLIEPLHGGKSAIEVLATFLGEEPKTGHEIVRRTFQEIAGSDLFEKQWRRTLHDGLLEGSQWPEVQPELQELAPAAVSPEQLQGPGLENEKLELVFAPDSKLHDGRYANNAWLQELPDFITKLTWDNAAVINPTTAEELGVRNETLVKLKLDGRELEIAAYVLPGQARDSITVHLGYGRTAAGHVGGLVADKVNPVGFDVYRLRSSEAPDWVSGLSIEPLGREHRLATTQDHHAIDEAGLKAREKRLGALIREADLEHFKEHPDFAGHVGHHEETKPLWKEHEYKDNKWAMSIDLNRCVGCNACVAACQSENNIPIVGKENVLKGREMHWIRVDRYFSGDTDEPKVSSQPVACHHCENAPCEQVCPVAATTHDSEGLNTMAYNRCIGTRYCSNNCPYKVRRFNYFNYHRQLKDPLHEVSKMVFNPEVTVRSRGVMEKCTFCTQRIQSAKIAAKSENRPVRDGEIRTACQQACPAQAIVFGNLNDPESQVAKEHHDDRAYTMLEELNIKPRTAYLAKIRNPNPELVS